MNISESKMKIVIENYFRTECNINTTIHEAFEKGFRIGVKKAIPERKMGKWIDLLDEYDPDRSIDRVCSICGSRYPRENTVFNFCPYCGAKMER